MGSKPGWQKASAEVRLLVTPDAEDDTRAAGEDGIESVRGCPLLSKTRPHGRGLTFIQQGCFELYLLTKKRNLSKL